MTRIAIAASSSAAAIRSFLAAPGSRTTSVWHSSRIAAATTLRWPAPVGPADAPGGEEGDRQPAEVEEQRERVAPRQQDPDRVQQLRVLRVEPVREDRLDVVHPGDRVALGHVRRERHVVPERVEVEDAPVQRVLRRQRPVRDDQRDDADHRRAATKALSGGWRRGADRRCGGRSHRRAVAAPAATGPAGQSASGRATRTQAATRARRRAARRSRGSRRARSAGRRRRSPRPGAPGRPPRRAAGAPRSRYALNPSESADQRPAGRRPGGRSRALTTAGTPAARLSRRGRGRRSGVSPSATMPWARALRSTTIGSSACWTR